ncbi:hypothetical protein K435DRAFT_260579 [Dendrothele bispora CBS 962.96]|uniref:Pentatricopeptide repeat-containing protein-mitochondrial domain-containing protein n=1 Tax=Dendrothele bispora (strain CBS 962.96) TaxID=1314807 RepID=A0A4S8MW51_DENBC|nr:hypothetical protein K435DRAFT_260579 [Dendrothele bispora CBS 962.96]
MSLRAGLFRLGRTLSTPPRHARPDIRFLKPPSRSIVFITENETIDSKFQSYVSTLKGSLQELDVIHQYYPALAWEVSQASSRAPGPSHSATIDGTRVQDIISRQDFEVMLEALGASGRPNDLQRMGEILSDMIRVFELPPDVQTHSAILRGLVQCRNVQTLQRWLRQMPTKPGHVALTTEHYHMLLEASSDFASFKFMRSLVQSMRQSDCLPTVETYAILIQGLWKLSPTRKPAPGIIAPILREMREGGIPFDSAFQKFLESLYLGEGLPKYAQDIKTTYRSIYESNLSPEKLLENQWIPRMSDASRNIETKLEVYKEFVQQGGAPSPEVFDALLQNSRKLSDMEAIANTLDMDPTIRQWSILLSNQFPLYKIKGALAIYQEAIAAGMKPEAALVGPLLKEIFDSPELPAEDHIKRGLDIYEDFCSHTSAESSDLSPSNLAIHRIVLAALTELPNEYSGATSALIEELQTRNVPVHDITASMIVAKMKQANDYNAALKVYKAYRSGLDAQGYESVLEAFAGMCLERRVVPSLQMYFSLVKDMKSAGFLPGPSVYTILLRVLGQIGAFAKRNAEYNALVNKCVSATRRAHDLITLDSSIVPDALLWNHLMDTYLRLNCFGDVFRVWDQMYISKQFDNFSVGIVFEVCGRTRTPHLIAQTYSRLTRENFRMSLSNWHSYIEALCSVGNINEALKALCWDMSTKGILPEVQTAKLIIHQPILREKPHLLKGIKQRIEKFQPNLHKQLEQGSKAYQECRT